MRDEQAQIYLLSKPFSTLDYPFGEEVKVFRVKNKMFATIALGQTAKSAKATDEAKAFYWMNLKCDPHEALILRDIFPSVIAGYHMNKAQWNSVILDGSIPQGEIERMIDNSFDLVVSKLTKKVQETIKIYL
ncbi:MmcQ/YjbR family DNA-binding protein [Thalassotalea fonticola]|uniref:MmcQ/YjbR family DNA-binding protein n=1 Tax=Thalassotalea fonticola TaxID=3065649 RepID=A0ABZ0GKC6_9GAMM|nr:MmcQ/YjbR family DNA-binding protein [Colwelliaceae bacterium S1-1]